MRFDAAEYGRLDLLATERAILFIKRDFQARLAGALALHRVSAPLFVDAASGLQDNLNGFERPVSFAVPQTGDIRYEIVHSLAKWKRHALARYRIPAGEGLYTDMNAIRPDEETLSTGIHSVYVDQWDWERHIRPEERTLDTLRATVRAIWGAIVDAHRATCEAFGLAPFLPDAIEYLHSEELLARYPGLSPRERENEICRAARAVFLIGIGGQLPDGTIHDGRAPDYDDWSTETGPERRGLNGDILVWNPVLARGFELSSMGVRVDATAMRRQLALRGAEARLSLPWHRALLAGELPASIGGGIGQSRLCMLFLRKAHIGEVQVSVWPAAVERACAEAGLALL